MGCDIQVQEVPSFDFDLHRYMITCLLMPSGSLTSMAIIFHCTLFIHCNMTHYYCTYVYVIFCMYVEIAFHTVFRTVHYCSLAVTIHFECLSPKNVVVRHCELIP